MEKISKSFPGVLALNQVDFSLERGEIHGLMGENGAGKSTLIKIMTGIYGYDSGSMTFDGKPFQPANAFVAQKAGISTIYQELNLVPYLSVCENIFIGREPRRRGLFDWKTAKVESEKLLGSLGIYLDVHQPLYTLSTAVQQMVAICRALSVQSKLFVLDEPTSSLTEKEIKTLFDVIRSLKEQGIAIVFITHKLDEIFEICDRVTVLKDGQMVGVKRPGEVTKMELVSLMIGRDANELFADKKKTNEHLGGVLLEGRDLKGGIKLKGVDITLRKGEVVGLAGLLGSGRTEVGKALFGADKVDGGEIEVHGKKVHFKIPADAIDANLAFCSEDRKVEGIVPYLSVKENITLAALPKISRFGIVSKVKQIRIVDEYINKLKIKTPSREQFIRNLSGGNQQKALIARWLCMNPELIILDEPTRGIDVGAKHEIELLIREMAAQGISVLMISSEMDELIRNCDRIVVMKDGRSVGILEGSQMTQDNIMRTIAGESEVLH